MDVTFNESNGKPAYGIIAVECYGCDAVPLAQSQIPDESKTSFHLGDTENTKEIHRAVMKTIFRMSGR